MSPKFMMASAVLLIPWTFVGTSDSERGARSQEEKSRSVAVNRRRPLADVVLMLEKRHGVPITYEDPPYRHATQRVNASVAGQPASFLPRGGSFSFEYVLPVRPSTVAMGRVLESLLRRYHTTGYAGAFQLQQTDGMFHVVPITRRAENGLEVLYDAVLSTELSFVSTGISRSALDGLMELTENLRSVSGVSVVPGTIPTNLLRQTNVSDWSGYSSARSQLIRVLASTGRRLSWRLLYDPNEPGMFVLNVHMLQTSEQTE